MTAVFAALRRASAGSAGGVIASWDTPDHNVGSLFTAATGLFVPDTTGVYWAGHGGFPSAGLSGGTEWQVELQEDGVRVPENISRDYRSGSVAHGSSNFAPLVRELTAGKTYRLRQINDTAENAYFSALRLDDAGSAFSAYKAASGSAGDVMAGYTAALNVGANFDATTGLYTASETGLHLMMVHGFPQGGAGSSTHGFTLVIDDVDSVWGAASRSGSSTGKSNGLCVLVQLTIGQTVGVRQVGAVMETVTFSGVLIATPATYFSARKGAASGVSTDTIDGWTADLNVGGGFNATTGVFTAQASKKHLILWHGVGGQNSGETQIRLLKNDGSSAIRAREYTSQSSGVTDFSHGYGTVLDLAATDTLELQQINKAMRDCYFSVMEIG